MHYGLVAGLVGLLGLLMVISPRSAWQLKTGWKFRNAEPSGLALLMHRVSGVILIGVAVWVGMQLA